MDEYEKMIAGQLYDSGVPYLADIRTQAHTYARAFNDTAEDNPDARYSILEKALGAIGKNSFVAASIYLDYGTNTYIGEECYFNFNTTFLDCAPIRIGNYVLVGPNVSFLTPSHSEDPMARRAIQRSDGSFQSMEYASAITVEDDVWIAGDVSICGGVTIGRGSIIGAGAVVTRDIPPYTFAAGNPCRPIRPVRKD